MAGLVNMFSRKFYSKFGVSFFIQGFRSRVSPTPFLCRYSLHSQCLKRIDYPSLPVSMSLRPELRRNNPLWMLMFIPVSIKEFFGGEEEKEETAEEKLIMHIKRSILLIQRKEFLKAERLLHVALKMAQDQNNQNGVTYIFDVMANLAFDKEEFPKAEKLFLEVLSRSLAAGIPQDDLKVVHISLKLAKIYENMKDTVKCQSGYEFCINTLRSRIAKGKKDEDTSLLLAMTLDWYARFLLITNRAGEALMHLKDAYDISVETSGYTHEQTVVLLNDLGTASSVAGEQDAAADYFERAISIAKALQDEPEMSSIMVNLGIVHLRRGAYEECKRWCNSGKQRASQEKNEESLKEANECLEELRKAMASLNSSKN